MHLSNSASISAGSVVGLRRYLAHHLRTHVGERVFELDLLGHRHTVLGYLRRAVLLVDDYVATLGAKRYLYCVAERVDTLLQKLARLCVVSYLLCHNLCLFLRFDV